jgi:hypothetical protein
MDAVATLANGTREERWAAARDAVDAPGGVEALAQALAKEEDLRVREAILTSLARVGTPEAVGAILPHLHADDANLRVGALDALRVLSERSPHTCQASWGTQMWTCGCLHANSPAACLRAMRWGCSPRFSIKTRRRMSALRRWRCWPTSPDRRSYRPSRIAPDAFQGTRSCPSRSGSLRNESGRVRPLGMSEGTPLTGEELRKLCEFLYRRTGMSFDEAKRYYVQRRVTERMAATGESAFSGYFARLRVDARGEVEQLINAFTVNETYFFREDHQLRCLSRDILPERSWAKRPGEALRIWSVPCATGEEPYSIAVWLLENWPDVDAYDVEIVGSDIDTRCWRRRRLASSADAL